MMHRYGYGNWERMRMAIRHAWQFKFDWFFKSRNALELQVRKRRGAGSAEAKAARRAARKRSSSRSTASSSSSSSSRTREARGGAVSGCTAQSASAGRALARFAHGHTTDEPWSKKTKRSKRGPRGSASRRYDGSARRCDGSASTPPPLAPRRRDEHPSVCEPPHRHRAPAARHSGGATF